jgi:hypothetical protein
MSLKLYEKKEGKSNCNLCRFAIKKTWQLNITKTSHLKQEPCGKKRNLMKTKPSIYYLVA